MPGLSKATRRRCWRRRSSTSARRRSGRRTITCALAAFPSEIPIMPIAPDSLLSAVAFDADGLAPVIAQEARTGTIRMVAWANREALARTLETGTAFFWSRSRKAMWRKGESSGHTLAVREVRIDCDGDVVLYAVDPIGPSCHTGATSCFYRRVGADGALVEDDGPPDPPAVVLARVARSEERRVGKEGRFRWW